MSYCMNDWLAPWKMIDGEDNTGRKRIEKHILRQAFDTPDEPYIPDDVLWRQKEQFSDGVSAEKESMSTTLMHNELTGLPLTLSRLSGWL